MFKTIKCSVFIGIMVGVLCMDCSHGPTDPGEEKVNFKLSFRYGEIKGLTMLVEQSQGSSEKNKSTLNKKFNIQDFNMVRILVIDMSNYQFQENLGTTGDWNEYLNALSDWLQLSERNSWAEWKGFVGDFFPIVTDQTLNIEGDFATGTVAGVIGWNHIIVGLTMGDILRYRGEGDAWGVSGEISEVEIGVEIWGNWAIQGPAEY